MIIFLSDIHLGWGDKADDFSDHAKRTFLRMRRKYPESMIIIVGDLFDTDNHLERTLKSNSEIFNNLWMNSPIIVPGNHDGDISWMRSFGFDVTTLEYLTIVASELTLITHGHQYDPYNNPDTSIGKKITRVVSFLERNVDPDIDIKLSKLREWAVDTIVDYEVGLLAQAKKLGCSQIIYGHIHQPFVQVIDGITITNCGTWTRRFERGYPVLIADKDLEAGWVNNEGGINV